MEEIDEMVSTSEEESDEIVSTTEEESDEEEIERRNVNEEERLKIMKKIRPQINSVKTAKSLFGGPFHSNIYEYIRHNAMGNTRLKLTSACTYFNEPINPLEHYNRIIFSKKGVCIISKEIGNKKCKLEYKKWDKFKEYVINADNLEVQDNSPIVMARLKSTIFINVRKVDFSDVENLETILPFFSTLKNCKVIEFSHYNQLSPNIFIKIIKRMPKLENTFVILSGPIKNNIFKSTPTLSGINLSINTFLSSEEIYEMLDNLRSIPKFHMKFAILDKIRLHPQHYGLFVKTDVVKINKTIGARIEICNYSKYGYTEIEKRNVNDFLNSMTSPRHFH